MKEINKLTSLKYLCLQRCEEVTTNGWKMLANLKRLEMLDLRYSLGLVYAEAVGSLAQLPALRSLTLDGTDVEDSGLRRIEGMANLCTISMRSCFGVEGPGLSAWGTSMPALTDIDLSVSYRIREEAVKALATSTSLTRLNLQLCYEGLTDSSLRAIARMPYLAELNISGGSCLTDEGVCALAALSSLTSLDLGGSEELTNGGVQAISKIHTLTSLNLCGCRGVSNEGVLTLGRLTNLRCLNLNQCVGVSSVVGLAVSSNLVSLSLELLDSLQDDSLHEISHMSLLRSLNLRHCNCLTTEGVKALARLTDLRYLQLDGIRVKDEGVAALANLKLLNCLSLALSDVTDAGLRELTCLQSLQSLNLRHCSKVTDKGVQALAGLQLKCLNLDFVMLTDNGVSALAEFSSALTSLSLSGCRVSDKGLMSLTSMTKLTTLLLNSLHEITDRGVKALCSMSSLKNLQVYDCKCVCVWFNHRGKQAACSEVSPTQQTSAA